MPVVLRLHRSSDEHCFYELVGECYLHTMMDGKAIDVQEQIAIPTKDFELR